MRRIVLAITFLIFVKSFNAYAQISVKSSNWFSGLQSIVEELKMNNGTNEELPSNENNVAPIDGQKEVPQTKEMKIQPSSSRIGVALGKACFGKYIKN